MAQLDQLILNTYASSMALVDWESWRSQSVSKGESFEGDRKKQLERVEILDIKAIEATILVTLQY